MAQNICLSRRAERLFFQIPICYAVTFGLSWMMARFILVLKESLLESPWGWKSILLLAFLVGSLSLIIVVACTGVGAVIGFLLRALFNRRLTGPLRRCVRCKSSPTKKVLWEHYRCMPLRISQATPPFPLPPQADGPIQSRFLVVQLKKVA
jgi:hypothetical protein